MMERLGLYLWPSSWVEGMREACKAEPPAPPCIFCRQCKLLAGHLGHSEHEVAVVSMIGGDEWSAYVCRDCAEKIVRGGDRPVAS